MYIRTALLLGAILIAPIVAVGQDSQGSKENERLVLDNPEVIKLEFDPISRRRSADVYEKVSGPFRPADRIRFLLVATNTTIFPLIVRSWDTISQNKPRLFRDNQEVAYREKIKDLIKIKHSGDSEFVRLSAITLAPYERKVLENFDLADWYEPLGPGHYELSTQHRFVQGGKWVDSTSITFEVEPNSK